MKQSLFPAKIILFGEYSIIENSKGISIPYKFYKGTFNFKKKKFNIKNVNSNHELNKYYNFLLLYNKKKT